MWGILAGVRTHQGGFARFEAQIRWGLVLFGCSVTRSGCAPTCGWLEACLPFRARIDDGLLLGESFARNIMRINAADAESRVYGNSCVLPVTTVSRLVYFARFHRRFENIVWFSSGLVVTLSGGGAPESPTS